MNTARSSSYVAWYYWITVYLLCYRTTETFYTGKWNKTILCPLTHASQGSITIEYVVIPEIGLFNWCKWSTIFARRLSNVHHSYAILAQNTRSCDRNERDRAIFTQITPGKVRQTFRFLGGGKPLFLDDFDWSAPLQQEYSGYDGVSHQWRTIPLLRAAENEKVNLETFIDPLDMRRGVYRNYLRKIESCGDFAVDFNLLITVQFALPPKLPTNESSVSWPLFVCWICLLVPHLMHFSCSVGFIKLHDPQCHWSTEAMAPMTNGTWLRNPWKHRNCVNGTRRTADASQGLFSNSSPYCWDRSANADRWKGLQENVGNQLNVWETIYRGEWTNTVI